MSLHYVITRKEGMNRASPFSTADIIFGNDRQRTKIKAVTIFLFLAN